VSPGEPLNRRGIEATIGSNSADRRISSTTAW
jgi:hypothetical protein